MFLSLRFFKFRVVLAVAVLIAIIASNRYAFARLADNGRLVPLGAPVPVPVVSTTLMVGEASEVFQKVNGQRKRYRLKPLLWNEKLSELALAYSKQMADEDFFSHYDPEGKSVADRADDLDITDWKKIGENLFLSVGYANVPEVAIEGWMKSRTHKDNILDAEWTHTGVGVYKTSDGRTFITQVFMTR